MAGASHRLVMQRRRSTISLLLLLGAVGTQIAVGFGQRYDHCAAGKSIGPSATLQIFVIGERADVERRVDDCKTEQGLDHP